jgi:4-diphosphocytidyl-2-C-methyl-D-erythritol kinase
VGSIIVQAPAKINLFLHITGKRADGYHLLDSLVVFADCGDIIEVAENDIISLEIEGKYASSLLSGRLEENLVWKAAAGLRKYNPAKTGAKIKLAKNLPVGSGIGGGSADAAAAIRALIALWRLDVGEKELSSLALSLGSDVPVCLYGRPAWMRGTGELITPVELPENAYIVLVNPNISVSTVEIFKEFKFKELPLRKKGLSIMPSFEEMANNTEYGNDLEPAAINRLSVIREIISSLEAQNGCCFARMSGSGATCFGIFKNESDASKATKELEKKYPDFWCISTRISQGN